MKQVSFKEKFLDPIWSLQNSDSSSFVIADVEYSYAQLFDLVEKIYNLLNVVEDQYVGIHVTDDIRTYASILALWFHGKTYVPLNPTQPIDRHIDTVQSVGIKYVMAADSRYLVDGVTMLYTNNFDMEGYQRKNTVQIADVDDTTIAYILFTSGSTGKPKGVQISRGNVANFIESMDNIGLDITSSDRCLQPFDLTFDFSVSSYVIPLVKGACVYTVPNKAIKYLYIAELLEDHQLTVLQMVPSMIKSLIPYMDELDLNCVRYNIFCGEALNATSIKKWHEGNQKMVSYNMYGPTEDTVFCTYYVIDEHGINRIQEKNDIVGIGATFTQSGLLLIDEDNNIITNPNIEGELCLCGPQLTPGYWNNEKENTEKFFVHNGERYYRTGDLCYYEKGGNLMYISRKDFQVKINGYRVELGEIESLYKEVSRGTFCIVLPYLNETGKTELAMIVEGKQYDYVEHEEYLKSKLPKYMIPKKWFFMNALPLNQNGKIDRKAIKSNFNL